MSQIIKKTTNMVGLVVANAPRQTLVELYKKTLGAVAELPKSSAYREQVEGLTEDRLGLVNATEDVRELEKKINCGLIEEVIIQAEAELELVEKMKEWEAWGPLESSPPPGQWN